MVAGWIIIVCIGIGILVFIFVCTCCYECSKDEQGENGRNIATPNIPIPPNNSQPCCTPCDIPYTVSTGWLNNCAWHTLADNQYIPPPSYSEAMRQPQGQLWQTS